ncbi:replicative DNA helicase [Geothrix limicola]|uniref:DNA 5'-3' helicase n=1 Tax=Geothrix limicola TaxID=2927978 RepID=A0ABQ5QDN8_9BACT|nr:replicative DNA helicase [Geothrix limicola]GLH72601.1 replicative DNA helicase [Geothrix limicola]
MADWLPERLPEDIDAERSFLATCCAPGAGFVASEAVFMLSEDDFVHPAHRAVFRALKTLIEAQVEVSSLTLKDALDQDDSLNKVGGYPGLVELLAGEDVERPQVLADVIRRKAKLRRLVHLGAQLVRQAAEEEEAPELLVDQTAQSLFHLAQGDAKAKGLLSIEAVADEAMERLADRMEGRLSPGIRVGFSRFDELTQGFQPGNLIVLAARPGIGKTALALNWILRAAQDRDGRPGHCGAFFSLEMSHEEVFMRLLSAKSQTNMKDFQSGKASGRMDHVLKTRDELAQMPLFISDLASITVPQIRNMVVKQGSQSNRKIEFVIIDYLQLLSSPEGSRGAKQNEAVRIGEISRGLKIMAKDFGIPVVVLSQLNREVEHRTGGRPQLSDLRDSGAIEQDADMVAFIHRKMVATTDGDADLSSAELIVAKHRNGPTAIIPLHFQGEYAMYRELVRETSPY